MPGNKIIDLIIKKQNENDSFISFEFFPPKTDDGVKSLMERIERYKHQGIQLLFIILILFLPCFVLNLFKFRHSLAFSSTIHCPIFFRWVSIGLFCSQFFLNFFLKESLWFCQRFSEKVEKIWCQSTIPSGLFFFPLCFLYQYAELMQYPRPFGVHVTQVRSLPFFLFVVQVDAYFRPGCERGFEFAARVCVEPFWLTQIFNSD